MDSDIYIGFVQRVIMHLMGCEKVFIRPYPDHLQILIPYTKISSRKLHRALVILKSIFEGHFKIRILFTEHDLLQIIIGEGSIVSSIGGTDILIDLC